MKDANQDEMSSCRRLLAHKIQRSQMRAHTSGHTLCTHQLDWQACTMGALILLWSLTP